MPNPDERPLDLDAGLRIFGHHSFRPGQREAVETLLDVGRLLLVAPTGGGKSLIYQLPASLLGGTTLVVSPLVSLMNDQVTALDRLGVAATFLAATLDEGEMRRRMGRLAAGHYKLVYVAPERLTFGGFRSLLRDLDCPLTAIDEAHCISEWGHDFRPEYLQLGELLAELPRTRVLACTATATPIVRDEILERLGLPPDTPQRVHGFARPSLALRAMEVRSKRERHAQVDATLREAIGASGDGRGAVIVYAPTRKATEEEAERLANDGWKTGAYHAGLPGPTRDAVHRAFLTREVEVVVATNAFGMGIDRADVRAVIHLAPPSSIEAYYQEVGRAGRDGNDAIGLLLISPADMALRRHLLERGTDQGPPAPEVLAHKWNLFLELMRWAEGGSCRHDAILRYFSDEAETLAGCGRCDVCQRLSDGAGHEDAEQTALVVRKALSAVARVHGQFGLHAAAKLLVGADDPRLARSGLSRTKTFGALSERSEDWIVSLLRRCVTAGWIDFHGGERPVVVLTEEGNAVMQSHRPARLVLPAAAAPTGSSPRPTRGAGAKRAGAAGSELDATGLALFEALRRRRLTLASAAGVPPYVIASDRTLRDLAMLRPRHRDELLLVHGIGPAKAEKYGPEWLAVVAETPSSDAR